MQRRRLLDLPLRGGEGTSFGAAVLREALSALAPARLGSVT